MQSIEYIRKWSVSIRKTAKQFVSALFLSHLVCFRVCLTQYCLHDFWCVTDYIEQYRWNITSILKLWNFENWNFENWNFENWNFEIWNFLLYKIGQSTAASRRGNTDKKLRSYHFMMEIYNKRHAFLLNLAVAWFILQSRSILTYLELKQICSLLSFRNRAIFQR